ncbi:GPO family capsid scaffolding protein [Pseudomonas spirodelae]|uniref:GPO family capsid scaffolding protein n=1 Tax=Pseudomonas spirodelae TaxID=3101751 RepID=A0ABU5P9E2_9PSED|nr:GPO family capsid scaffolding protein [Pseudomonas sp. T5W1]MEA1606165.1 GPO family capsid scaffolding protein [Pseudomonas sp. T5W1]
MSKKFRSKWFRVAVEGATTDGRQIERQWLTDAAETYNPSTYSARVWIEHLRSLLPDSPFKAYGDVLALKTDEVDVAGVKKLGLFAQIEPTAELVAMVNGAKQKLFTSIEISPKFADSGRAYLSGLAVTDTPASLGTEMLAFSAQHPDASPLKARKQDAANLFTAAEEATLEFEEIDTNESKVAGLFTRVLDALNKSKDKTVKDDAHFSELTEAVEAIALHAGEQVTALNVIEANIDARMNASAAALQALQTQHDELGAHFAALLKRLDSNADHSQQQRPAVTGGDGQALTAY